MIYILIVLSNLFSNFNEANLYPEIKNQKFENDYNFINDLWYHKTNASDFDRDLSQYFFIADKTNAKLYLYFYNGDTKLLKSYNIVSGELSGDKEIVDDKKTPEGIYFFDYFIDKKTLLARFGNIESKQYGPLAVTLNYPNPIDKIHKKTGNGIWIHGVEENGRVNKKFDTRGCIAAANDDIPNITKYIQTGTSPIIIMNNFTNPETFKILVPEKLFEFIHKWQKAWETKDIDTYMSNYDEAFIDPSGKDKVEWRTHKNAINKAYSYISVKLFNLSCYPHEKYIVCQFFQEYSAPGKLFKGIKRLYIKNNDYKIMSEEFVNANSVRYIGNNL